MTSGAHLLPPLLRRPLQLSGLVVFGVEQVDVVGGVADQHLSAVLAVAQRRHAARLVRKVGGDEPHAHAGRPSAHVVTYDGGGGGGGEVCGSVSTDVALCYRFFFFTLTQGSAQEFQCTCFKSLI